MLFSAKTTSIILILGKQFKLKIILALIKYQLFHQMVMFWSNK